MMMYLANNTRPDIAFTMNQVARFANNLQLIHEQAVKQIGKYLKGSLYIDSSGVKHVQGTIYQFPAHQDDKPPLQLDLWANADFSGLRNIEDQMDPTLAKSRTGFVVTLSGLALVCSSKLQQEIKLSMAEAEFASLSTGMRLLVPLRGLFLEVAEQFKIPVEHVSKISHAFKDNQATLIMATCDPPRLTAQSKHWNIKHHWF